MSIASVILVLAVTIFMLYRFEGETEIIVQKSADEIERMSYENMQTIARSSLNAVKIYDNELNDILHSSIDFLESSIARAGGVNWNAPINSDSATRQPLVDDVTKIQNVYTTIFKRMDDKGTMKRIQTSIINGGKRAVNTDISATTADGSPNQIIKTVLSGKIYEGRANVLGTWVNAVYKPVIEGGKVVGMLFAGSLPQDMAEFINQLRDVRYGKSGKVYAIGAKGTQRGLFTISMNGIRDGKMVIDEANSKGERYMEQLVDFALALPEDSIGIVQVNYRTGKGEEYPLVSAEVYYAPWDWVIGVSMPKKELESVANQIKDNLDNSLIVLMRNIGTLAIILLLGSGLLIFIVSNIMLKPLKIAVKVFDKIEKGDLTLRLNASGKDEVGDISRSFNSLIEILHNFIKNVHNDSETLADSSKHLTDASIRLAGGSEETVNQSNTVASTTEQMAVNINAMASGAEEASANANEVASAAEEMTVNMDNISGTLKVISGAATKIANAIAEVKHTAQVASIKTENESASMENLKLSTTEIEEVTDVIKKIADKTNLLALNATIEAASAGEAGKGFAVVAGEIKELANQSSVSADNIAEKISSVQKGVSNALGVINSVTRTIEEINHSVGLIMTNTDEQTRANNEIAKNVDQAGIGARRVSMAINEVAKGANDVARNAGEAAKGATNVSQNVVSVSQVAKDSATDAAKVEQFAIDLSKISIGMKKTIEKFKV
ncbi:methyl-accepting chemotaxis protein [Fibrobacterales bacterium]|nr:methyl-accepting chemotaxis protein [Fibrobacterales bacterium]